MVAANLIIKRANTGAASQLRELSVSTFLETFGPPVNKQEDMDSYIADQMSMEQLCAELADNENLFFLAYYQDQLIGYAKMRAKITPTELSQYHAIEIERLYVIKEYQSKKAGATLMNHCLAYATQQGYDMVWLGVWEHNQKALKFYKDFGFELFGSHPFVLGDDVQTDVLMRKAIG